MMENWIIIAWFAIQLLSGYTIGIDQFKGFGSGQPIPNGRWPRLVHRDEEPAFYWILIAVQVLLLVLLIATRSPETMIQPPPQGLSFVGREG